MVAPLVGDFSIIANVILIMAFVIIYIASPDSAKILIKKKLGLLKNKTLNFIAWDDRVLQLEAEDVAPEGMLESKTSRKGTSKSFYLAKPQDDTANVQGNLQNLQRDLHVLPLYSLDGIPVGLSHISKAIVTNPKVIAALSLANHIDPNSNTPNEFNTQIELPSEIEIQEAPNKTLKTRIIEVLVRLPFDPVDIKRNFPLYWQQANIDSTKRRNRNIGAELEKGEGKGVLKMFLIVGLIACIALVIGGAIAGKFFG